MAARMEPKPKVKTQKLNQEIDKSVKRNTNLVGKMSAGLQEQFMLANTMIGQIDNAYKAEEDPYNVNAEVLAGVIQLEPKRAPLAKKMKNHFRDLLKAEIGLPEKSKKKSGWDIELENDDVPRPQART